MDLTARDHDYESIRSDLIRFFLYYPHSLIRINIGRNLEMRKHNQDDNAQFRGKYIQIHSFLCRSSSFLACFIQLDVEHFRKRLVALKMVTNGYAHTIKNAVDQLSAMHVIEDIAYTKNFDTSKS